MDQGRIYLLYRLHRYLHYKDLYRALLLGCSLIHPHQDHEDSPADLLDLYRLGFLLHHHNHRYHHLDHYYLQYRPDHSLGSH